MNTPSPGERWSLYSTLLTDVADGVATVTLHRPERMNAWTPQMGAEVKDAIADLDSREDVRVIVVTGSGRAFCAGADIGDEAQSARTEADAPARSHHVPHWELNTPIIAAMNGPAVGVGMSMAMQWDLRIVAEDAKYGFVFNRRGMIPEMGSCWLLTRLIGLGRTMDLLLTGRIFKGTEAVTLGVANECVPADQVLTRATEIARDIATNTAPVSAGITKRLVNRFLTEPDRDRAEDLERELSAWVIKQPDLKEGIGSFLERREPAWTLSKNADFPDEIFAAEATTDRADA